MGLYVTDLYVSNPFAGAPALIPGNIEAEDFDRGGDGVAFHAPTSFDRGGDSYRSDGPGLRAFASGHALRLSAGGEWFKYRVNVISAGAYTVTFRLASTVDARFYLEANGVNITGPINLPSTGNRWVDTAVR